MRDVRSLTLMTVWTCQKYVPTPSVSTAMLLSDVRNDDTNFPIPGSDEIMT
jgi:hypothetical protein